MLGDTYKHLDIDRQFVDWVERDRVLEESSLVVEWLGANPFAHEDPRYVPGRDLHVLPRRRAH
jgi:hypothetical protein